MIVSVSASAFAHAALWPRWRAWAARVAVVILLGPAMVPAGAAAEVDIAGELDCLALTIYFEARGEPVVGQIAVGHVVMNRVANPLFPSGVCDVVQQGGNKLGQGCQFTWWCDELSDTPTEAEAWQLSQALARHVFWSYTADPTAGALWYHADYVAPYWRSAFTPGPKIGRHIFYRISQSSDLRQRAAPNEPLMARR